MADPITLILGGSSYSIPPLNLGQRKRITQKAATSDGALGFDVLMIALERAEPRPMKIDELMPSQAELLAAFMALAEQNGLAGQPAGEAEAPVQAGATSTAS